MTEEYRHTFGLGDIVINQNFPWAEWMVFKLSPTEVSVVKTNGIDQIKHITDFTGWWVKKYAGDY